MRHEGSWAARGTSGQIAMCERGDDAEYEGAVHTPHGTVLVHSYLLRSPRAQTIRLETVIDGRVHYCWERRPFSRAVSARGLKILAGRWARQVWRGLRDEGGGE